VISRSAFLRLEWALSLALIAIALAWGSLRGLPLMSQWRATPGDVVTGAAAGAALWLWIPVLGLIPSMQRLWSTVLAPFSRSLRMIDIVVIAVLSAVSEELFFRGVLLPELGVVASSVLFGMLHALNRVYVLWAALTGAGLGLLVLYGGSLVTPVVAHATYNVGALIMLRRWQLAAAAPEAGVRR
jgi:hypothetical protein